MLAAIQHEHKDNGPLADSAGPRILVVDDDRVILASLEVGLHEAGYDVSIAASAREAVDQIRAAPPDLIVLDMRMPGMDGLQFAEHIRDVVPIPILVLSAYSDQALVQGAVRQGVMGYLLKPVDIPELIPAIEAALARGRDLAELRSLESRLSTALATEQKTRTAVGVLMERQGLDQQAAYEALRRYARSQRRKIADVAQDIVNAAETLNALPTRPDGLDSAADAQTPTRARTRTRPRTDKE